VCKPPKDCNDCSQKKVRDSLPEEVMKRIAQKIGEKLETDDLPKKSADKISGGIGDIIEKIVKDGGSPQDQQTYDENRGALEGFVSQSIIDIYRSSLGDAATSAIESMLDSHLPSSAESNQFVPPDPSQLTIDKIKPIFSYDEPSLDEALDIVNKLAEGNSSGAFHDVLERIDGLGVKVEGSAGNNWKYGLSGSIEQPFKQPEFKARAELRFSSDGGLNDNQGLKLNTFLEFKSDPSGSNWSALFNLHMRFSQCTCCYDSLIRDLTAPRCELTGGGTNADGKKFIQVTAQDGESFDAGLVRITVLSANNATVPVPPLFFAERRPVNVIATKNEKDKPSSVALAVADWSGNITLCDPVVTQLRIRRNGKPVFQSFSGIPQAESRLTLYNGSPGLVTLVVVANGTTFKMRNLRAYEERTIDLSSAMVPGNSNTVTLQGFGLRDAGAAVLIHDLAGSSDSKALPFVLDEEASRKRNQR
jgi:hypothetical protein